MKTLTSSSSSQRQQPLQNLQSKTSHVLAKTATWVEHFFLCCAAPKDAVNDDAMDYDSLPSDGEYEYDTTKTSYYDPKPPKKSGEDDASDRAIVRTKSFFNQISYRRGRQNSTRSDGSIVFLDAMEPHVRPVLHLPASASSIRTATTASMSSSIPGAFSFDEEEDCDGNSMVTTTSVSSAATTQVTRPRSISSATTAKFGTHSRRRRHGDDDNNNNEYRDEQHSIRQVQTEVLPYLPQLSATDGYRC